MSGKACYIEKEALEFLQNFLETEYKITLAKAREDLNQDGFNKEVEKLDVFYMKGLKSGVIRPYNTGTENFSIFAEEVKIKAIRKIFLIRVYKHTDYEIVYRAYVSTDREKGNSYFFSYYFAKVEDSFKIISQYLINDARIGWEWKQGIKFKINTLEFLGVNRFIEPNQAKDCEDYKSEAGSDYEILIKEELDKSLDERSEKLKFMESFRDMEDTKINNSLASCLCLLKGRFYTNGFFREGSNPKAAKLKEKDLKEAIVFSKDIVKILRNGECTSLDSEGDKGYYPFVYCGEMLLDGLPDFAAKDDVPKGAIVEYDTLGERFCIFWYDEFEEDYEEDLVQETLEAFKSASDKMKSYLKDLVEFSVVHGTEYPVVIGGTFSSGIFAGIVTTRVHT
ncbi:MAG: hypothetical protein K0R54_4091 [Clostridiaceae bacterium]|jgi:hypothetical protein|nr:hypothetical protein [Clostridiaceae bacterium]